MIHRILNLQNLLEQGHSAFLFGPRGVGKTYLCKQWLDSLEHVINIDLLIHQNYVRYISDSNLFYSEIEKAISPNHRLTVFIDEVQKYPALLDEVHSLIEKHQEKVQFILTGSSARKLKRGGANLLAGRAWTLHLHPLTHLEGQFSLAEALQWGTLPAIQLDNKYASRTLSAYVETYLKEEILQEALVRKVEGFIKFLDLAAQLNGEPINFTKIAKQCQVSSHTIQEYYSILVDTLVANRINPWGKSTIKQLSQAPKYYFFDCGVLNTIRREQELELNPHSYRYGKLFETFVVQEIIRFNDYYEKNYNLTYWRTNTGLEVDLILSTNAYESPIAIEIKSKSNPNESDLHALKSFYSENTNAKLICLCTTPRAYKLGDIEVYPWEEGIKHFFYA